jgi:hypothetical protein
LKGLITPSSGLKSGVISVLMIPIISDPVTGFIVNKLCQKGFLKVRMGTLIVLIRYAEMVEVSRVRHVHFISTKEWSFVQRSVLVPVRERMNPNLNYLECCRHDLVLFISSEMGVVTLVDEANRTSLETQ